MRIFRFYACIWGFDQSFVWFDRSSFCYNGRSMYSLIGVVYFNSFSFIQSNCLGLFYKRIFSLMCAVGFIREDFVWKRYFVWIWSKYFWILDSSTNLFPFLKCFFLLFLFLKDGRIPVVELPLPFVDRERTRAKQILSWRVRHTLGIWYAF